MLGKLLKMQVLEDDDELAYGGDESPGTERREVEVRGCCGKVHELYFLNFSFLLYFLQKHFMVKIGLF